MKILRKIIKLLTILLIIITIINPVKLKTKYINEKNNIRVKIKKFKKINKNKKYELPKNTILPFITLLILISTGPIFYEKFWNKNYKKISIILSIFTILYYVIILKNTIKPIKSIIEYIEFISLIISLYVISECIMIKIKGKCNTKNNIIILAVGSLISNIIGTIGSSMILIKPYINANRNIKSYHIIFFIFIVSNIGGSLTPIGDPPLLLGFLKGVPFSWTIYNNHLTFILIISMMLLIFYIIDKVSNKKIHTEKINIKIYEKKNLIYLAVIIISIFINNENFLILKESIIIILTIIAYKKRNKRIKKKINFKPIKEIIFIFMCIFISIEPTLEIIKNSSIKKKIINKNTLYWSTGGFSAFLDNAPTYINSLSISMSNYEKKINNKLDIKLYANGIKNKKSILDLKSISISSVFFGAMTYIGNAPNFIIKSISIEKKIKMPSFMKYIVKFSIPILIPILYITWILTILI